MSSKSVPQVRVPNKRFKHKYLARVLRKSVKQECPTSLSHQCVMSGCAATMSGRKCDKYCLSLPTNVSAFGFVGFILFFAAILMLFVGKIFPVACRAEHILETDMEQPALQLLSNVFDFRVYVAVRFFFVDKYRIWFYSSLLCENLERSQLPTNPTDQKKMHPRRLRRDGVVLLNTLLDVLRQR